MQNMTFLRLLMRIFSSVVSCFFILVFTVVIIASLCTIENIKIRVIGIFIILGIVTKWLIVKNKSKDGNNDQYQTENVYKKANNDKVVEIAKQLLQPNINIEKIKTNIQNMSLLISDKNKILNVIESAIELVLQEKNSLSIVEKNFLELAHTFSLSSDDFQKVPGYYTFFQQLILKTLSEGKIPANVEIMGDIPVNLMKEEKVIWMFPRVKYSQIRERRRYEGNSYGWIFGILKRSYFRMNFHKGRPIYYQSMEFIDTGTLIITNLHLYFASSIQNFRIKYNKILSFMPYKDAIRIQKTAEDSRPLVFQSLDGNFAYQVLKYLCQSNQ